MARRAPLGNRHAAFYASVASEGERDGARRYVPVIHAQFFEAHVWWKRRTRGAFPRSRERVQQLYQRAFAWADAHVAGFGAHDRNSPSISLYRTCIRALVRIFIVCEERDMSFEFVIAHALLRHNDDALSTPVPGLASVFDRALENSVRVVSGVPIHPVTLDTHNILLSSTPLEFTDYELAQLDQTRLLQDACAAHVPMHLECARRPFNLERKEPLRDVAYGPRDLARIRYVDPYVMAITFGTYQNTPDGRDVSMAFALSKHADEKANQESFVREAFRVRPMMHVGAGSYEETDFTTASDMACMLLVRARGRWIGVMRSRTAVLCDVTLNPDAAFNAAALRELDIRPTHDAFDSIVDDIAFPDDLLRLAAQFSTLVTRRPDSPREDSGAQMDSDAAPGPAAGQKRVR